MKHRKKRVFFICFISLVVCLIISSPIIISHYYLPKEVKLIVGKEHIFNFDIPLKANLLKDQMITVKGEHESVIDTGSISLNKPLYVSMNEAGKTDVTLSLLGFIPLKTVSIQAIPNREVIPCGKIVGIKVDTKGILVLGIGQFEIEGKIISPCKGLIEPGDMILKCNDMELKAKEDLRDIIETTQKEKIKLTVLRNKEIKEVMVQPSYSMFDNEYKIGLWIRDSTQGIGTLTYIDPETGSFGALGHGITDTDTKKLMPIREGNIITTTITHIKKGKKGIPGEISGIIEYEDKNIIGEVINNTPIGIYGELDKNKTQDINEKKVPIAFQDEVHEGKASILVDLTNDKVQEYEVYIQKVSKYSNEPAKGMIIKIVDERLLNLTNGIIQGMSGSPILQDGKLIGAVTHVFIQDPTRGYGIFIENMINNEKR
ncbi:SpoIVB peptidase [Cellulosilyticum sp. I15G10I2]|uniref:SpoIVB peptidase n=1 Tax=Cellulosilyticum sp. I15G10I2 TaxID=1892843 RepID=UPI00085C9555|nr:SpoIVB peptidase [Cellulosilyticum sp. I15G10I2]